MERQRVYRVIERIGGGSPEAGFTIAPPPPASKPVQKPRQRRWTPKVKTGCITCRIRRVKCDEGRPACKKCISTGRKCDGFEISPEPEPAPCASSPIATPCLHALTPIYGRASPREREMFNLFRTKTVTQVSGAFYQPFWHVDVLLAAQTQPAIWHASLSMAAMYAWFKMDDDDDDGDDGDTIQRQEHYRFALRQHNEAIAHLVALAQNRKEDDARSAEVLLMASVLFTGLSSLRGDPREAMMHASHGLRVAQQWQFLEKTEEDAECGVSGASSSSTAADHHMLPTKSLVGLIDGFEVQYMWTGARQPILRRGGLPREVPVAPFRSATEACFELQRLVGGLLIAVRNEKERRTAGTSACGVPGAPAPVPDLRQPYRHALSAWKVKFSHLKWSQRLRQSTDHHLDSCALVLDIWLCGAEIASSLDLSQYELAWDTFAARFRRIIKLTHKLVAEEALQEEEVGRRRRRRPVYSFSPSVCEPLFMVASSCRDGQLRREAIALLRQRPRREGIWDARLMAAIAEAKMHIEESGVVAAVEGMMMGGCGCIPGVYVCNTHRVFFMDIEFLPDRAAMAVMKTLQDVAINSEGQIVRVTY
ncbi:C6 zinc finger domain protein [Cordyceps fumosorosea ARSEF 2679]|uniref:C6 zinc finger domain protein n=1 Tax=Cordyceps fumosorosea (strain ARSEF 2679) TaxID=1081104 RepID=A0A167YCB4_CORFA|nr:C6 zinc finger domain protein [Cordyceps fumosorosea ARSEF 2679]OAA66154.1 C6 zinc finger domain protein [Cordyceps fumosorosea ARSEF 2679]